MNREFYIRLPLELVTLLGATSDCILKVVKPLYRVPEAGNHWFATYHGHHVNRLGTAQSTYDPCLLYKSEPLGKVGLQTDNTLILADDAFAELEEDAIKSAKIMTKARDHLTSSKPIKFNGTKIELALNGNLTLKPNTHIGSIGLVKKLDASTTSSRGVLRTKLSSKDQYVAQRARRAYLASICQPEASFDLSYAAQSTEFTADDVAALNKRLQ